MAHTNTANFNTHPLTHTDVLYFTVTVFTTVGFGDITGTSQSARLAVTAQLLLDLVALACAEGLRLFGLYRHAAFETSWATDSNGYGPDTGC